MRRLSLIVAAIALVWTAPLAAQPAQATDAAQGARDFRAFGCAACHGTTGAGGGWQGPPLAPLPLPYAAFLAQLREPAAKMPRYSAAVLSDRQAAGMHAYLQTVKPGPRTADIEMLNR